MNSDLQTIYTNFFADLLGFAPELELTDSKDQIDLNLSLDQRDSGMFIGYRGEVLTAIQLILSLINQHHTGSWKPVRVNVNDYRQRRQAALEAMADAALERALASGQPSTLTNLTSYERRIIHTHLASRDDVTTHSQGQPPRRDLIISPK